MNIRYLAPTCASSAIPSCAQHLDAGAETVGTQPQCVDELCMNAAELDRPAAESRSVAIGFAATEAMVELGSRSCTVAQPGSRTGISR
ncbi:hypothetical protein [Nocardia sp. NPDC050175]|uniref:hypothetical protein n=1 Tax=Nocardia sp. NPDC050175 TaxID=3364317 RepID=UPI0037B90C87